MNTALRMSIVTLLAALSACVAAPLHSTPLDAEVRPPRALWNVPFWTLGGKQLWADELWESGWRIQKSVVTGHHRLVDPGDVRRAWGNFGGCMQALERCREAGAVQPVSDQVVVLLHGIWRSKDSMSALAGAIREAGYSVAALNYPSSHWPIEGCATQIERVLNRLPASVSRVSFVTHSMGGLVARELLGSPARGDGWRERLSVDHLVMLFPPNQGAFQADKLHSKWWYRATMGPAGQQLVPEVARRLPVPAVATGVIAGGRGDDRGRSLRIPGDDDGDSCSARDRVARRRAHCARCRAHLRDERREDNRSRVAVPARGSIPAAIGDSRSLLPFGD